ncbi:MAG: Nif3-like dinuclear metal center hexameric protein [Rubrivivax sp.]|jgi:dinuclear metal center YbgI/SA1388 family protein|nr:Nif3-like dinuclear metal center hexameric protein [Rubrivivax sp.]
MVQRQVIDAYLRETLAVDRFKDYGPNGLQVEGRELVGRLMCGVTASLALIEAAVSWRADALLVHHGLFWRGQDGRLTGWLRQRVASLMAADINLWAFHLPLDAHPEWGNNAQLGLQLGLRADARLGDQDIAFIGDAAEVNSLPLLTARLQAVVQRPVLCLPGDGRPLRRIAWCSGGAQGYFEQAIQAGADAYITGEVSEPQAHLSRETGVAFLACGHHASERYGVQALAAHLGERFGLEHRFVDIDNPA